MTLAERIAKVKNETGYVEDRAVEEFEGWHYGDRVRVIEEDEDEGIFEGEEGYVVICRVGAAQYANERTMLAFLADGTDTPTEIAPDAIEDA